MTDRQTGPQAPDQLDQAIGEVLATSIPPGPSPDLIASTSRRLLEAESQQPPLPQADALVQPASRLWSAERKSRMFRIARYSSFTAAGLLLAIGLAWLLLLDRSAGTAFAQVLEKVKQAESVTFLNVQKLGVGPQLTLRWSMKDSRIRLEIPGAVTMIGDLDKRKMVQLNPAAQTGSTSDIPAGMANAFANPVLQFRNAKAIDAKPTGEEQLDGRKTTVYSLSKLDFLGLKGEGQTKVWVDQETDLPVKIVVDDGQTDPKRHVHLTFEQFQWNVPLDDSLFSTDLPAGYREVPPPGPGPVNQNAKQDSPPKSE